MPDSSPTIPARLDLPASLDYAQLRAMALSELEQLVQSGWTDFNSHDPGITILEALAYAMTELGLKVHQEMGDLISSASGATDSLRLPSEVLPGGPLTLNDYRSLLIDHPHVRNATLQPHQGKAEVAYFFEELPPQLSLQSGALQSPQGLYEVIFEFTINEGGPDPDPDLNSNTISRQLMAADWGLSQDYTVDVVLPYWDQVESKDQGPTELVISSLSALTVPGGGGIRLQLNSPNEYFAVLAVSYTNGSSDEFGVFLRLIPEIAAGDTPILIDENPITPGPLLSLLTDTGAEGVPASWVTKHNLSRARVAEVEAYLRGLRNLGEDVWQYRTLRTQEIAVLADVELKPQSDPVDTLAEIFFQIDAFLSPDVRFQSLEGLQATGLDLADIYEGPRLQSGFLTQEALTRQVRLDQDDGEQIIYTSDLVRLIKALNRSARLSGKSQIADLKNLALSNYINNLPVTPPARNCLKLTQSQQYQPRLSFSKSRINLYQGTLKLDYDLEAVRLRYEAKVAEAQALFETHSTQGPGLPSGKTLTLSTYRSFQAEFPPLYKLNPGELSPEDSPERQAQARQLKAYLLGFDQCLLNEQAQLTHLNELFALHPSSPETYFTRSVELLPDAAALLGPTYASQLADSAETELQRLERRHQFLDHLLARHAEDPTDFNQLIPELVSPSSPADIISALTRLETMKVAFLDEYPGHSAMRAQGHDYRPAGGSASVWDTTQRGGFAQRLTRLLGIVDPARRNLTAPISPTDDGEGFWVIEHVLLRPRVPFLPVNPTQETLLTPVLSGQLLADPYSMVLTLVFPSGYERDFSIAQDPPQPRSLAARFRSLPFRTLVARIVRQEVPAHMLVNVFWVDHDLSGQPAPVPSLANVETAQRNWMEAVADDALDEVARLPLRNALIALLNQLMDPA